MTRLKVCSKVYRFCGSVSVSGQPSVIFHHELKDEIRGLVFCGSWRSRGAFGGGGDPSVDISNLAKAAVAGDEKALDLFSVWDQTGGPMGTIKGTLEYQNSFVVRIARMKKAAINFRTK